MLHFCMRVSGHAFLFFKTFLKHTKSLYNLERLCFGAIRGQNDLDFRDQVVKALV